MYKGTRFQNPHVHGTCRGNEEPEQELLIVREKQKGNLIQFSLFDKPPFSYLHYIKLQSSNAGSHSPPIARVQQHLVIYLVDVMAYINQL